MYSFWTYIQNISQYPFTSFTCVPFVPVSFTSSVKWMLEYFIYHSKAYGKTQKKHIVSVF